MGENSPYQQNLMDVLQVVSLMLGLQNLQENREQSAHNDVQAANDKQAQFLLEELTKMFQEQNGMLLAILSELRDLNNFLYQLIQERSIPNAGL